MIRRQAAGRLFDGWYGALYDLGVESRRLAPLGGLALWGCDMGRVYRTMAEGIACDPGQVVVDVPTGGGVSFAAGAPDSGGLVVGADVSRGMLKRAAARLARLRGARISLVQADAGRLPFGGGSVDRVLCFNSLHCLSEEVQGAALREFRRVLKPGGELVGTTLVADAAWPWRASVAAARVSRFFHPPTQAGLAAAAARAGFTTWHQDVQGALVYFGGE